MHCKPYCSSSICCPIQIILMFYTSNHTCTIFLCSLRLPPPTNIKLRFERAKNRGLCVGLAAPEKRQRTEPCRKPATGQPAAYHHHLLLFPLAFTRQYVSTHYLSTFCIGTLLVLINCSIFKFQDDSKVASCCMLL